MYNIHIYIRFSLFLLRILLREDVTRLYNIILFHQINLGWSQIVFITSRYSDTVDKNVQKNKIRLLLRPAVVVLINTLRGPDEIGPERIMFTSIIECTFRIDMCHDAREWHLLSCSTISYSDYAFSQDDWLFVRKIVHITCFTTMTVIVYDMNASTYIVDVQKWLNRNMISNIFIRRKNVKIN